MVWYDITPSNEKAEEARKRHNSSIHPSIYPSTGTFNWRLWETEIETEWKTERKLNWLTQTQSTAKTPCTHMYNTVQNQNHYHKRKKERKKSRQTDRQTEIQMKRNHPIPHRKYFAKNKQRRMKLTTITSKHQWHQHQIHYSNFNHQHQPY